MKKISYNFLRFKELQNQKWFTLIEILISITILWIIMVSVISIYITASETSTRSDINRALQENVKNFLTEISDDITKNGISGVSESTLDSDCNLDLSATYKAWDKLCISSWNEYYLAKDIWGVYSRVDKDWCSDINDLCFIAKNGTPITNSLVAVKELEYIVSDINTRKVTIKIILQPSVKSWVKWNLIESNRLILQTTISQRPF